VLGGGGGGGGRRSSGGGGGGGGGGLVSHFISFRIDGMGHERSKHLYLYGRLKG